MFGYIVFKTTTYYIYNIHYKSEVVNNKYKKMNNNLLIILIYCQ